VSIPTPASKGRSYLTSDTLLTRGINVAKNLTGAVYLALVGRGTGRFLLPGEPLVLEVHDRTGEGQDATWIVRLWEGARASDHPSYFHVRDLEIFREYGVTQPVAELFQIPAEDIPRGFVTLEAKVTVSDPTGRIVGTAELVHTLEFTLFAEPAVLVPDLLFAESAEAAFVEDVLPASQVDAAVLMDPTTPVRESTPSVLLDPFLAG